MFQSVVFGSQNTLYNALSSKSRKPGCTLELHTLQTSLFPAFSGSRAERFEWSCSLLSARRSQLAVLAVLAEVVKVRANVIDWTKCWSENTVPQSMPPLMARGGAPRRPRRSTDVTKSARGAGVTFSQPARLGRSWLNVSPLTAAVNENAITQTGRRWGSEVTQGERQKGV